MHCLVVEEPRHLICSSECIQLHADTALFWERSHFCSVVQGAALSVSPIIVPCLVPWLHYARSSAVAACASPWLQFAFIKGCSLCPCYCIVHSTHALHAALPLLHLFFSSAFWNAVATHSGESRETPLQLISRLTAINLGGAAEHSVAVLGGTFNSGRSVLPSTLRSSLPCGANRPRNKGRTRNVPEGRAAWPYGAALRPEVSLAPVCVRAVPREACRWFPVSPEVRRVVPRPQEGRRHGAAR